MLDAYLDIEVPRDEDENKILKPLGTPYDYDRPRCYVYNLDASKRAYMLWSPPIGNSCAAFWGKKFQVQGTPLGAHDEFRECNHAQLYLPLMNIVEPMLKRIMEEM